MIHGAKELIAHLDAAVPTVAEGTCRHCAKVIVFKPYFLDGRGPNPPIWYHPPGSKTCSTVPDDWRDGDKWPIAEPVGQP